MLGFDLETRMARRDVLTGLIQRELADGFLKKNHATEVTVGRKDQPPRLLGIAFDLVAYSVKEKILWACEMTASGFLGKGEGNRHVGANRKFCEGFAKFFILKLNESAAKDRIRTITRDPGVLDARLECRFVVPTGSRFIQALEAGGDNLRALLCVCSRLNSRRVLVKR
jgi:hypothetical protein